jgi:xanthine/uracil permease
MDKFLNSKLADKISGAIETIAHSLGVASEHVYKLLVHQMFIDGLVGMIQNLLVLVFFMCLYFIPLGKMMKYKKSDNYDDDFDVVYYSYLIGGAIVLTIVFLVDLDCMVDNLRHMLNPEYFAVFKILKAIK